MALERDRPLLDVAENTQHLTFKKSDRATKRGERLPMLIHERLAFSPEEYVRRYDLIQEEMNRRGLDALLIRGPENITYFSGYETPGYYKYHCVIVPKSGEPIFVVRDFEWVNTPEFSWNTKIAKVYDWDHPPSITTNVLKQLGLDRNKKIGVEKRCFFYTVDEHETFSKDLPENTFVDATEILWNARLIKSPEEVEMMRRSARLVDAAITAGMEASKPGTSANHINAVVNASLFEAGGEYMGLPPFVLVGPQSSLPHQTGGANTLASNDLVYFEVSASQRRYAAALMRTIFLGTPPEEWIRAAHACVEAVDAALAFIRPGVTGHEADSAARVVTTKAGFAEYHRNRLGYSVGVNYPPDWGEGEIFSLQQEEHRPLKAGMTFHMPPLCLKYREFGIGFSETIHITANGCERLSNLPRKVVIKKS
jgi:Xaa-Pro dipeptidase